MNPTDAVPPPPDPLSFGPCYSCGRTPADPMCDNHRCARCCDERCDTRCARSQWLTGLTDDRLEF